MGGLYIASGFLLRSIFIKSKYVNVKYTSFNKRENLLRKTLESQTLLFFKVSALFCEEKQWKMICLVAFYLFMMWGGRGNIEVTLY